MMDKSWITSSRISDGYKAGCKLFIEFAKNVEVQGTILCPCVKCCNGKRFSTEVVFRHILFHGFCLGYTTWNLHGEHAHATSYLGQTSGMNFARDQDCEMSESNEDGTPLNDENIQFDSDSLHDDSHSGRDPKYQKILEDCDKELYPGSKHSLASFNMQLFQIKCIGGISNQSFTMLLEYLKDVFPFLTSLPTSAYEAKKLCKDLEIGYEKIHSCPNDCMLYWGEKALENNCLVCGSSRWKLEDNDKDRHRGENGGDEGPCVEEKKKAAKVLRYFPLIPRLKKLYSCKKFAVDMRWHKESRISDGFLRHPADGKAWKHFDELHPEFAEDPRSVRLGLATDGFNPFRTMSTNYSTWPVLLIPYNLPPWLCMKQSSFILSMIIPGEKSPGNDIDIYLQPLIHELKQLWCGVGAFDAVSGKTFELKAMLMWTLNDLPAYSMMSGWSTKGRVGCPVCADSTCSIWLRNGKKFSYMGHRRWLEEFHSYRSMTDSFNGTQELRMPPKSLSGSEILEQIGGTVFGYGKTSKASTKKVRDERASMVGNESIFEDVDDFLEEDVTGEGQLWKKRSILFDLSYWKDNLLMHNLDVMHIEKNICDNIVGTLLNLEGKSKDNEKARLDIKEMGIRPNLHPIYHPNMKPLLPDADFTLSSSEKDAFLQVLKYLKVPDAYASNISRGVNLKEQKLSNLKSHDAHILMQDILPIACKASIHSRGKTGLVKVISDLCSFFKKLCQKVLDPKELDALESEVAITLCELERLFLPGFFTIMVHLVNHLAAEAKLGGPVMYRWMYPIERFLRRLKSYVRNKAQPEGSIAEGYIAEECITFCSRYFEGIVTPFNQPRRNEDTILSTENYFFKSGGRVLGKVDVVKLDDMSLAQAHRYVLLQSPKISPYLEHFLKERQKMHHGQPSQNMKNKWVVEDFPWWLQKQVQIMERNHCDEEAIALARGPRCHVKSYKAFIINGFRFQTKDLEAHRKTQNSGIVVEGEDSIKYFGSIRDIYELDYFGKGNVVLFRCDWVNVHSSRGFKKDKYGFPLVSFTRLIHTGALLKDDPFVLSSNAKQVFYVQDGKDSEWMHVVETKPRDLYDMGAAVEICDEDSYTECMPLEGLS